jgi:hypothetical protein
MYKTSVSSGNCLGITVAVIVFLIGLTMIAIPVWGWIIGPFIMLAALFMGGKIQKVWKCHACGAIAYRD